MIVRLGHVVYWACTALAVLVLVGGGWGILQNAQPQNFTPDLVIVGITSAVLWVAGRAALYVLAGTKGESSVKNPQAIERESVLPAKLRLRLQAFGV